MSDTTPGGTPRTLPRTVLEAGTDDGTTGTFTIVPFASSRTAGKVTGHTEFALTPSTQVPPSPEAGSVSGRRPALVLLDGPVRPTPYLEDAFWEQPAGWAGGPADVAPPLDPPAGVALEDYHPVFPSHYAHATFITGLVRQVAPDAHVVSVPVATADGSAEEPTIVEALRWLVDGGLQELQETWDVAAVLLPSGRRVAPWQAVADLGRGDTVLEDLRHELVRLGKAAPEVTFVASAGNWGSDERAYPAWFARDLPNVVAVGALDRRGRRIGFSAYGDWVRAWEIGVDLLSCTPFQWAGPGATPASDEPGFATWSGTSFAAAVHAARITQSRAALVGASTAVEPTSVPPAPKPAPSP